MKRIVTALAVVIVGALALFAQSRSWELLRAEYGSGDTWVDVTLRVRSLVSGDSLNFRVDNDTLGGDPAPGTPKTLRLQVRDERGRRSVLSYREKDVVSLSLRPAGAGWGGLRITRAQYGANHRSQDVTDLLNSRIQDNQLSLRVTNSTMGGDPAPDTRKVLSVWYTYNGQDLQVGVSEGETLNLPGAGVSVGGSSEGGLQILRADYGVNNRYADVTSRLAARVQGDRLSLRVTNDTMGRDPAEDRRKTLTVWYRYNGETSSATVNEGDYLNLPGANDRISGNLRILRAQYGADYRYVDVTDRLNSQIQGDQLSLRVTNETMGGDPASDRRKQLTVSYLYNGHLEHVTVNEKEDLKLPASGAGYGESLSEGLRILRATYGAGDRVSDVTDRLSAQVTGDQLQIQVSNATMGGDPAEGQRKRLTVIYLWQGLRCQTTAAEGDTLVIP